MGHFNEYHPENKWDVGHRLAFLALHETYGRKDIIASGPMYKSLDIEGYKVKINFDHTGSGLTTNNGKAPNWFEIAGSDKKFVKAKAKIEKNKVVISNSTIKKPVFVRYAWSSRAHTNLCNKEGLPAFPFNTAEPFFQNNSKGTQQ
jgi:sialate O-acetylesterase